MKYYGDIDVQSSARLTHDNGLATLPVTGTEGEIAYVSAKLYVCINSVGPVWIELTNVSSLYVHTQGSSSTSWVITHNLGIDDVIVSVYDAADNVIIPDEITITDSNTVTVTLNQAITGKAVILGGDSNGGASVAPSVLYDIGGSTFQVPDNGAVLQRFMAVRDYRMPTSLTGSFASSAVATTGAAAYPIKKNGVSIGTIDYAAAATAGTFTFVADVDFAAGDVLTVEAPATADATHDGLVWTFKAQTI